MGEGTEAERMAAHIAAVDREIQAVREEHERYCAMLDARWRERVAAHFAQIAPDDPDPLNAQRTGRT